jgi:hypothetical protein
MIRCAAAVAACFVAANAGAGAANAPLSLVAAPSRVALVGDARRTIELSNTGRQPLVVDVTRAGLALDLRGRPRPLLRGGGPASPASWLRVAPQRVAVAPGARASIVVRSRIPTGVPPGDRAALVLLTTRPLGRGPVEVRTRIGIVVLLRKPGAIARQLRVEWIRVARASRPPSLEVLLVNRGGAAERLNGHCLALTLRRAQARPVRLEPVPRELLPGARGIAQFAYRSALRGWFTARLEPGPRESCAGLPRRAYRVRL